MTILRIGLSRSFKSWLLRQRGRDDWIGDLAEDVASDGHRWPRGGPTLSRLLFHLESRGACAEAKAALCAAWAEWEAWR